MPTFSIEHEINCSVDTFWSHFFDKNFNSKLYKEALGFPIFEITEQVESDSDISRIVIAKQKLNLPKPISNAFGTNFQYTEEGWCPDKTDKDWVWKRIPIMPEGQEPIPGSPSGRITKGQIILEGKTGAKSIGENKTRLWWYITIQVRVFGITAPMQSFLEKGIREEADGLASFFNSNL